MADIFLSYAREDAERAARLARLLTDLGWSVFWDRRILAGTSWEDVLDREIRESSCVVVLWSTASVTSDYVKNEARFGLRRKVLVPVALDDAEPPLTFHHLESAQLQSWSGSVEHPEWSVLTESIAQHAQPKRSAASNGPTAPTSPRTAAKTTPALAPVVFAPPTFRSDVFGLPDEALLGFVEIPAGAFTMGSDKRHDSSAFDDEQQQHQVTLDRFYIGRYEVTVGQMRAFVDAGGKLADSDALKGASDLPVVHVNWHEALAYAQWLDASLRQTPAVPAAVRDMLQGSGQSCRITLPSEAEWEKAARGTDGRAFPWGNTFNSSKVNFYGSGKSGPTAVGSYPDGASPSGLLDMSGNVSEWTRSHYKPYPYQQDDGREQLAAGDDVIRVVRGGSFLDNADFVRAAVRDGINPRLRIINVGFRVVASCLRS